MTQLSLFPIAADPPKFAARPYQELALKNTRKAFESGKPGAICRLPTGAGKTITAGMVARWWLDGGDRRRVMIAAHERQLVWQFAQEMRDVLGEEPRIEMGDQRVGVYENPRVVVASRQTLQERATDGGAASRLYKFDATLEWLLVIDEAHRWSHRLKSCKHIVDWFGQNPNSRRFGITATPYRSDNVSLEKLFPAIACDYRLVDLDGGPCAVSDGWAVPYRQFFVQVKGVDFASLSEVAGDWEDTELERVLSEQKQLASYVDPTVDIVGDRRTLIFSPGVEMAKKVAAYINAKLGRVASLALDGSVPDASRQDVYRRHQRGEFQFLSVCGLCREGYNDPGIGAVAIYRPTKSRSLAEQMKGRGCRPLRGTVDGLPNADARRLAIANSAKPDCLIVDLVGVTGLADAASTADIYASALPDEHREEIINRANATMSSSGEGADVAAIVRQSRDEVLKEAAERKQKLLEKQRLESEAMQRMVGVGAKAEYTATEVAQGEGAVVRKDGTIVRRATPKQLGLIRAKGLIVSDTLQFNQASRIIGMLMRGCPLQEIEKKNRGVRVASPVAPPVVGSNRQSTGSAKSLDEINRLLSESY